MNDSFVDAPYVDRDQIVGAKMLMVSVVANTKLTAVDSVSTTEFVRAHHRFRRLLSDLLLVSVLKKKIWFLLFYCFNDKWNGSYNFSKL